MHATLTVVQQIAAVCYGILLVSSIAAIITRPERAGYILPALLYAVHAVAFYAYIWQIGDAEIVNAWSPALRIHGAVTATLLVLALCLMPRLTIRMPKV